jgi:hypothetical protein
MDKKLTLEKIENSISKTGTDIRNKKRSIVKMSFGNFISEM